MQFLLASMSLGRCHYRYFTKSKMRPQKGNKRSQTFSCEDSNWTQTLNLTLYPTLWCLPFYSWKLKVLVTQSYLTLRLLCSWKSPGKIIGAGCHSLLQGIFLTLRLNPGLLHCRQMLYVLNHLCSPFPLVISKALTDLGHTATILRAAAVSTLSTKTTQGGLWKPTAGPIAGQSNTLGNVT